MSKVTERLERARVRREEAAAHGRREAVRRCVSCGAVREGDGMGAILWPAVVALALMVGGLGLLLWGMAS